MTTRGVINSNFYQIVEVDVDGNPTQIKAGYVDAANVSNLGNIATINLDNSSSNVLYGNGIFAPGGSGGGNSIQNGNSNVTIPLINGNVYINANSGVDKQWNFDTTGNVTLSNDGVLGDVYNDGGTSLKANPGGYALLASNDLNQYVQVDNVSVYIGTNLYSNNHSWEFRKDGDTTFPAGSNVNLGNLAISSYFQGDGGYLSNIPGGNVTGTVAFAANATYALSAGAATTAGTVAVNSQPNITSVGTLTGLTVDGVTSLGSVSNVHIDGGTNGYVLQTDGAGNLTWTAQTGGGGNGVPGGSNTQVQYNNSGNFAGSSGFTFDNSTSIFTAPFLAGDGYGLSNISGANVSGEVAYANTSNNVFFTNVHISGSWVNEGAIMYNNGGNANVAAYLYYDEPNKGIYADGNVRINGVFIGDAAGLANIPGSQVTGNVGNALYAYSVDGANVIGEVANANYASYAGNVSSTVANANYASYSGNSFSVDGANVIGEVANANYASFSGIAYSVAGANVIGTVANANYSLYSGNSFSVDGANVVGEVANANYATYAGNVSGTVANANYAAYAGNVINATQSNITSVGTLTSLTVSGNTNSNNIVVTHLVSANNFIAGTQVTATTLGGSLSLTSLSPQNQRFTGSSIFTLIMPDPTTLTDGAYWYINNDSSNNIIVKNHAGTTLYTVLPGANTKFIYIGSSNWDYHSFLPNTMSASATTANLANLVVSNYFSGNGSLLTGVIASSAANANYSNYSGNSFSVTGSNVVGEVANANYASYAGDVINSSQSNITSVGTLTSLTVSGNIGGNNITVGNLISANGFIAGTQTTATTLGGSLSLTNLSPQNQIFTGSNVYSVVLPSPATVTSGAYWYINNDSSDNIIIKDYSGGTLYTVLPGASSKAIYIGSSNWDVHSFIPSTMSMSNTTANLANLVVSNYFSGNGSLLTGVVASSTANANYANFAGNVVNSSQSNITSVGTLTSLTVSGNITGNAAIALYGNGGAMTANVSVTNYYSSTNYNLGFAQSRGTRTSPSAVTAGDTLLSFVTLAYTGNGDQTWDSTSGWKSITPWITTMVAQPTSSGGYYSSNIRMVTGNATSNTLNIMSFNESGTLTVPGNITATNGNLGNLTISNYYQGTLTTASQPNITTVGTLGNLSVTNTGNIGNINMTKFNETVVAGGSVSGTITPQAQTGTIYTYTLTGSITLNTITNAVAGTSMTILLTQGGSGSYTLTSTWKFSSGSKTLSTAVGTIDAIFVFYDGTSYYATLNKGYV